MHEEIDAAYIVYNEFKSVIPQRLVVEKLLPLIEDRQHRRSPAPSSPPRKSANAPPRPRCRAGIELEPADTTEADEEAKKFGTAERGLHLRAAAPRNSSPGCFRNTFLPCSITP